MLAMRVPRQLLANPPSPPFQRGVQGDFYKVEARATRIAEEGRQIAFSSSCKEGTCLWAGPLEIKEDYLIAQ
jgi:hypothetical protein